MTEAKDIKWDELVASWNDFNRNYAPDNVYQKNTGIMLGETYLTVDDILLKPRKGVLKSRSAAELVGPLIFTAPMDSVCNLDYWLKDPVNHFVKVLPRTELDRFLNEMTCTSWEPDHRFKLAIERQFISIGSSEKDLFDLKKFATLCRWLHAKPLGVCLDIAHGHSVMGLEALQKIKAMNLFEFIMSGSVATGEGAIDCIKAGANVLRVGIGGGSMCTTRSVSNAGSPNASAVFEVSYEVSKFLEMNNITAPIKIVADGGVDRPGKLGAYLVCGADAVMIGTAFAACKDSAAVEFEGSKFHRGQASTAFQLTHHGKIRNGIPEGISKALPVSDKTIEDVVNEFLSGLRSTISYCGVSSSNDLTPGIVEIIKCSPSIIRENGTI